MTLIGDMVGVEFDGIMVYFPSLEKALEAKGKTSPVESKPGRENKSKGVSLRWQRERIIQQEIGLPPEKTRELLKTLKEQHPKEMKFLGDKEGDKNKLLSLALPLAANKFRKHLTEAGKKLLQEYEQLSEKDRELPDEKRGRTSMTEEKRLAQS